MLEYQQKHSDKMGFAKDLIQPLMLRQSSPCLCLIKQYNSWYHPIKGINRTVHYTTQPRRSAVFVEPLLKHLLQQAHWTTTQYTTPDY